MAGKLDGRRPRVNPPDRCKPQPQQTGFRTAPVPPWAPPVPSLEHLPIPARFPARFLLQQAAQTVDRALDALNFFLADPMRRCCRWSARSWRWSTANSAPRGRGRLQCRVPVSCGHRGGGIGRVLRHDAGNAAGQDRPSSRYRRAPLESRLLTSTETSCRGISKCRSRGPMRL